MANESEKVLVLIDGGNTYGALYRSVLNKNKQVVKPAILNKGQKFDYKMFAEYLANGRAVTAIKYYIGIVRDTDHTKKSAVMVQDQQKFLQKLENSGLSIERGRIVYDNTPREKGVDVKIAIDLVVGALKDEYDRAILISSDSDLVPAVKFVTSTGKKIEYIGFSNRFSTALLNESSEKRIFVAQDLKQFIV